MKKISRFINVIARCASQYRSVEFEEIGLNGSNHMYIFYLCRHPGVSQEHLSKLLHVNKSNVTRSLRCLEEDGFIYRCVNEKDKRNYCIYPTEKAKGILPFLVEKIDKWNEIISNGLTEEESEVLYELLKKVAVNATLYDEKMKEGLEEDEANS